MVLLVYVDYRLKLGIRQDGQDIGLDMQKPDLKRPNLGLALPES